jgi:hypothetical protein
LQIAGDNGAAGSGAMTAEMTLEMILEAIHGDDSRHKPMPWDFASPITYLSGVAC